MRSKNSLLLIAASVAAIFVGAFYFFNKDEARSPADVFAPTKQSDTEESAAKSDDQRSDPKPNDLNNSKAVNSTPSATSEEKAAKVKSDTASNNAQINNYPPLNSYDVAQTDLSDEELSDLIQRLKNDPELLANLLNEYRAETDPARFKRLTYILGRTGMSEVLPVAEELVYSGDIKSRTAGLDILNQIAPTNPAAYDIAHSILGSESDPEVLVATMNVFANPTGASPEVRSNLVTQVTSLADHDSSSVRRYSVQILTRLTNDPSISPILTNALYDQESKVREAAVYAYADHPYQTEEVIGRLLEIVEDESEVSGVRRGAIHALSKTSPDELMQQRIDDAKRQMRAAKRAK